MNFKFPGGLIEDSENLKESAKRETNEEIGCKVDIVSDPYFYIFKPNDNLTILLVHYQANIIEGVPSPNTEIEEVKWFDLRKLPQNVFENVSIVLDSLYNELEGSCADVE